MLYSVNFLLQQLSLKLLNLNVVFEMVHIKKFENVQRKQKKMLNINVFPVPKSFRSVRIFFLFRNDRFELLSLKFRKKLLLSIKISTRFWVKGSKYHLNVSITF